MSICMHVPQRTIDKCMQSPLTKHHPSIHDAQIDVHTLVIDNHVKCYVQMMCTLFLR